MNGTSVNYDVIMPMYGAEHVEIPPMSGAIDNITLLKTQELLYCTMKGTVNDINDHASQLLPPSCASFFIVELIFNQLQRIFVLHI